MWSFGTESCNLYYWEGSVLLINDTGIGWIYVSVMKLCKLIMENASRNLLPGGK